MNINEKRADRSWKEIRKQGNFVDLFPVVCLRKSNLLHDI